MLRSDFHACRMRVTAKLAWRRAWFIHAGCLRSINFVVKKCSMNSQWMSVTRADTFAHTVREMTEDIGCILPKLHAVVCVADLNTMATGARPNSWRARQTARHLALEAPNTMQYCKLKWAQMRAWQYLWINRRWSMTFGYRVRLMPVERFENGT